MGVPVAPSGRDVVPRGGKKGCEALTMEWFAKCGGMWICAALTVVFSGASCDPRAHGDHAGASSTAVPPAATASSARSDAAWGGRAVAWRTPDEGLEEAKKTGKPVLAVVFTTWCPHCKSYSKVFDDPRVADAAKQFVMIRQDGDKETEFAANLSPDGTYVPRTFFLRPDGSLMKEIRAHDGRYRYFYDEDDPAPLLAAMERARGALPQ
jgi:thiol-disulfide isomerase/thioredoxin